MNFSYQLSYQQTGAYRLLEISVNLKVTSFITGSLTGVLKHDNKFNMQNKRFRNMQSNFTQLKFSADMY
jgi:hypothetical protein